MKNPTIIRNQSNLLATEQVEYLNDLCNTVLNDEYEYEKKLIDQDAQMSATDKIKARRQTALFYIGCSLLVCVAYEIGKSLAA